MLAKYKSSLIRTHQPIAQSDKHHAPGLIHELVPMVAAVCDDVVVVLEDPVGEPVVAHGLADVFHDVQLPSTKHLSGVPASIAHKGYDLTPFVVFDLYERSTHSRIYHAGID